MESQGHYQAFIEPHVSLVQMLLSNYFSPESVAGFNGGICAPISSQLWLQTGQQVECTAMLGFVSNSGNPEKG